jgi:hypothetical protein
MKKMKINDMETNVKIVGMRLADRIIHWKGIRTLGKSAERLGMT